MASASSPPSPARSSHPEDEETTPLIRRSSSASQRSKPPPHKHYVRVVLVLCIVASLVNLGSLLGQAPLARLYESILCERYWSKHSRPDVPGGDNGGLILGPNGGIEEELCKVESVQDMVAVLFGWQFVWNALPGLVLAIPYGRLADSWGRKKVLRLVLVGIALNFAWIMFVCWQRFSLYAVWFSSAFLLIGGGQNVGGAVLRAMAADVTPVEQRTSVFLWVHAANMVAEMVGPAISSALMRNSVWSPLILGLFFETGSILILEFLPETLQEAQQMPSDQISGTENEERSPDLSSKYALGPISVFLQHVRETIEFIFHDRNLALGVTSFTFYCLGDMVATLLLQYVSKRYGWRIADAALLGTLRAAVNLLLYLAILPAINHLLIHRLRISSARTDLSVSQWSVALMSLGFLVVGIAPTAPLMIIGLVIYTCGTGYSSPMRSVCMVLLGDERSGQTGQLFTIISVLVSLGGIVAGPLLPLAFHWGQEIGGMGLGLPFVVCAVLLVGAAVQVLFIRLPEEKNGERGEEEESENDE